MTTAMAEGRKLVGGRSVRWDDARAQAAYEQGLWVRATLADTLRQAAADQPERVLVVDGDVSLTAAQLYADAQKMAHAMLARFPAGSVVSFMLPNWHEAATIYLAATLAGMVANPVLPSLREHDLGFILKDVDCRMIFIPSDIRGFSYADMLSRVVAQMENPPHVVVLRGDTGGHMAYDALLAGEAGGELPAVDPDSVRMIMYTSGTTGRPKGVMHTHNTIHALICQLGKHWLVEQGDKFLVPSPISHIGGSIYAFEMPLLLGSTAVLMDKWNSDDGIAIMVAQSITHMAGATPFLEQLLASAQKAGTHLPTLKLFICGGASVPPSLIRQASDYFDKAIVTRVYGSTEVPVSTVGVVDANDVDHAADTDGRAGIAQIKLADGEGKAADTGEICVRGAQMLVGYHHAEDEASAFDAEGYYRSGDVGRWIDGDFLMVSGRIKDIIIRNGENIAPKEIEDLLLDHPAITEIAIVGVPDDRTGERACAVIVAAAGAAPDVPTLANYLIGKGVAKFKIPEEVHLWDALPKNDAGKVLKHKIRADLIAAAGK